MHVSVDSVCSPGNAYSQPIMTAKKRTEPDVNADLELVELLLVDDIALARGQLVDHVIHRAFHRIGHGGAGAQCKGRAEDQDGTHGQGGGRSLGNAIIPKIHLDMG